MTSLFRWDGRFSSNAWRLANEFCKERRVFYVNYQFTLKDLIAEWDGTQVQSRRGKLLGRGGWSRPEGFPPNLWSVDAPVFLPNNKLSDGALYRMLAKHNDRRFFNTVMRMIRHFEIKDFTWLNVYNPYIGHYPPKGFNPALKVYYTVDAISEDNYTKIHGPRLEQKLMREADFVMGTSKELVRMAGNYSDDVHFLPNAADIDLFKKANDKNISVPDDISDIDTPVIMYTGNISLRINYPLLVKTAKRHTDKTLVMVGPVDNRAFKGQELYDLPNVRFTGTKEIEQLPAYLSRADCVIIPFELTKLTASIYPLKINEYLASGRPTVLTRFSDLSEFDHVTYVSDSDEEFMDNIQKAIDENTPQKETERVKASEGNTWQARTKTFHKLEDQYRNRV